MAKDVVHEFLQGIIDYAGLFPPAKLDMPAAVDEFARQRAGSFSWMLGRFVVPVTRLDELEEAAAERLPRGADDAPWGLSVLVAGDAEKARPRIDDFDQAHAVASRGLARVESVEYKPQTIDDIARAAAALEGIEVFFELPHASDPTAWMQAVAAVEGRAKIRSGGITGDAFPSSAEVAAFVKAAAQVGIPFKATAGLHHPLRGEYRLTYEEGSPSGTMHGFLNVFLAAAAVRAGLDDAAVQELLEERSIAAIQIDGQGVTWRGHHLETRQLADARQYFARSYGSCSFAEPVEDLHALGVLSRSADDDGMVAVGDAS